MTVVIIQDCRLNGGPVAAVVIGVLALIEYNKEDTVRQRLIWFLTMFYRHCKHKRSFIKRFPKAKNGYPKLNKAFRNIWHNSQSLIGGHHET